jgi:hypothetical protein
MSICAAAPLADEDQSAILDAFIIHGSPSRCQLDFGRGGGGQKEVFKSL